jgi:hypothetical protein
LQVFIHACGAFLGCCGGGGGNALHLLDDGCGDLRVEFSVCGTHDRTACFPLAQQLQDCVRATPTDGGCDGPHAGPLARCLERFGCCCDCFKSDDCHGVTPVDNVI